MNDESNIEPIENKSRESLRILAALFEVTSNVLSDGGERNKKRFKDYKKEQTVTRKSLSSSFLDGILSCGD